MAEYWQVDVLDQDDRPTGLELPITGGSLDWSQFKPVRGGGSLSLASPPDVDWLTARLRIRHHRDGEPPRPVGVWLPILPGWQHTPTTVTGSVAVLDKTELLNQPIGSRHQVPAGTVITDTVAQIIRNHGEEALALTPSAATTRTALLWEPQDTWLKVANDLLDAAGYAALWVDPRGWWRAEPWTPPNRRPVIATYGGVDGDYLMTPAFQDEADLSSIPNEVIAIAAGDDTRPGLIGRAQNTAPDSPLSIPARGRVIRRVVDGLEAASQAVIDQHARRLLAESSEVTRRVTWTHPLDDTDLGDRIHLRPLDMPGVIVERKITLGLGAVVTDTARNIYTGGNLWQY